MPSENPTQLSIGRRDRLLVIKLTGRCTLSMGPGLSKLLDQCRRPQTTDVYFDLSEAEHMDSTCVGLLVSLALKRREPAVPEIHIVNPTATVRRTLETMRVLEYLDQCDTVPAAVTTWVQLPLEATKTGQAATVIIEAHENLIRADARNAEEFGPVVAGLRAHQEHDPAERHQ